MLILKKWAAIPVTFGILLGCTLQPGFHLQQKQTPPEQSTLQQGEPLGEFSGELKLEINPALLGDKYKNQQKFSLTPAETDFQILSRRREKPIKPKVECVQKISNSKYRAYFGYQNEGPQSVTVPIGSQNKVLVSKGFWKWHKFNQGQPSTFQPGRIGPYPAHAFSVEFNQGVVSWIIKGRAAVASKRSKACPSGPTPTPVGSSTPTPQPSESPSATPSPLETATPTPEPTPTPTLEPTPTPVPTPSDVVFDPVDPGSLADLYPDVPGNKNLPAPETTESFILLNDHIPEPVAAGHIAVQFADPVEENLQSLLNEYNAKLVTEPVNGMYFIQPDLTRVDVSTLADNLRTLNGMASSPDQVVTYGAFGNLEAAKTLAFAASLSLDPRIKSVGFDPILELASGVNTQEQTTPSYDLGFPIIPSADNSWWLNERSTWITHAWEYSLGFSLKENRPINIAVIDGGFTGTYYHNQRGKDLENQILWGEGAILNQSKNFENLIEIIPWTQNTLQQEEALIPSGGSQESFTGDNNRTFVHGTQALATISSRFNNGVGTAGVAPYSKIIPIKIGYYEVNSKGENQAKAPLSSLIYAIEYLHLKASLKVDIVNISMNRNNVSSYIYNYFDTVINQESWIAPAQYLIRELSQGARKMVFVNSAGNTNYDAQLAIPSTVLFPEMITVGALVDNPGISTPLLNEEATNLQRTLFKSQNFSTFLRMGSNYGNTVTVWAPGDKLLTISPLHLYREGNISAPSELLSWAETSAAAPVISGIVALLKGIDPSLTGSEIKQILVNTSRSHTYVDEFLRTFPVYSSVALTESDCGVLNKKISCGSRYSATLSLKVANALNAVQSLPLANKAQTHTTVLEHSGGPSGVAFRALNRYLYAGDSADLSGYQAEYLTPQGELAYISLDELHQQFYPNNINAEVTGWFVPNTDRMQILKIRWLPGNNPVPTPTPTPIPTSVPMENLDPTLLLTRQFSIDTAFSAELNQSKLSTNLISTFSVKGAGLSINSTVSVLQADQFWLINDEKNSSAPQKWYINKEYESSDKPSVLVVYKQITPKWFVRAFNVNDRVNIIVNDQFYAVSNLGYGGFQQQEITQALNAYPQANTVRFQVFNDTNNTGSEGSSWGFELVCECPDPQNNLSPTFSRQIIYHDVHGIASGPNRHPARRGSPSLGLVYDQVLTVYKNGVWPSSGSSYYLTTQNVSDSMDSTIFNDSPLGSTQVFSHTSTDSYSNTIDITSMLALGGKRNKFEFKVKNGIDGRPSYTYGMEIQRTSLSGTELVFRHRDGEKENLNWLFDSNQSIEAFSGAHLHNLALEQDQNILTSLRYLQLPIYQNFQWESGKNLYINPVYSFPTDGFIPPLLEDMDRTKGILGVFLWP